MTPTIDEILATIVASPGISTLDIVRAFTPADGSVKFERIYHCIRVKISNLADRGEIFRLDTHAPGHTAYWYPRGYTDAKTLS